jgi:hypothetical protein
MNEKNRIPEKRPILFELFCPKCGGSLYALDEEEIYIGRVEHSRSPAGFTITKLECVLCREEFDIKGIGLKYEKIIADELGWPFPAQLQDGPSAIPEFVEKRMRKREQEPDPRGDLIENHYADHFSRSPLPLEKEILRYVLKLKGRLTQDDVTVKVIRASEDEGSYNAQILKVSARFGMDRKTLPAAVHASEFSYGDIIESNVKDKDGSTIRAFYIVYNNAFHQIAVIRK